MNSEYNYHTHTYLCKHGTGHVWDYCEEAVRNGLVMLGMTDHVPYPADAYWTSVRMFYRNLDIYVAEVAKSRELYAGRLRVLLAAEAEYVPEMAGYFRDELLGARGMDYLMMAPHSYLCDGEWVYTFGPARMDDRGLCAYTKFLVEAMSSGLYAFVAHPDLFGVTYRGWSDTATSCCREICRASKELGVPLELNTYGMRKSMILDGAEMRCQYPHRRFWEIAGEEGVETLVNSDAHNPGDVVGKMADGFAMAAQCGVTAVNEQFAARFSGQVPARAGMQGD